MNIDCDDCARQRLYTLFDNIGSLQADHNPSLVIDGMAVNQFQPRACLPPQIPDELQEEQ